MHLLYDCLCFASAVKTNQGLNSVGCLSSDDSRVSSLSKLNQRLLDAVTDARARDLLFDVAATLFYVAPTFHRSGAKHSNAAAQRSGRQRRVDQQGGRPWRCVNEAAAGGRWPGTSEGSAPQGWRGGCSAAPRAPVRSCSFFGNLFGDCPLRVWNQVINRT